MHEGQRRRARVAAAHRAMADDAANRGRGCPIANCSAQTSAFEDRLIGHRNLLFLHALHRFALEVLTTSRARIRQGISICAQNIFAVSPLQTLLEICASENRDETGARQVYGHRLSRLRTHVAHAGGRVLIGNDLSVSPGRREDLSRTHEGTVEGTLPRSPHPRRVSIPSRPLNAGDLRHRCLLVLTLVERNARDRLGFSCL